MNLLKRSIYGLLISREKKIGSSIGKNIPELGQCYIRLSHGNVSDSVLSLFMQYTAVQKS